MSNICPICGRPEVDPMTLNSVPVDRSMCYQSETGNDSRCKRKLGTCYETAFHFLLAPAEGWDGCVMIHGRPTLTRPPFIKYGHAWIELGGMVYDTETKTIWPRRVYYHAGNIDPADNIAYTRDEAAMFAVSHQHYGPWEGPEACGPITKRRRTRSRLPKIHTPQETTP